MSSTEIDAIISDYFSRLEALLAPLPSADRDQLLADIREHVEQARAGLDVETPDDVRAMLERVGRPEEIAAEALDETGKAPGRRRLPVLAGVIVVVGAAALALGVLFSTSSAKPADKAVTAPTATVGGFPTGIAYDPSSGTVYVGSGVQSALTAIDAATCNATTQTGCADSKTISTGGNDAIGVAVNDTTGTVYAVNGGSQTVAVIDAHSCNAQTTAGCAKSPPLVSVPGGPEFLAVNEQTNSVYVADTSSGAVTMIDGTACDASDHSGCAKTPASVTVGPGAFPIVVDEGTNTAYVGTLSNFRGGSNGKTVWVIAGNGCDATTTSGCSKTPASLNAGSSPAGMALDPSTSTLYVSSEDGTLYVIDAATCNGQDTSGCAKPAATVHLQVDSRGAVFDPQSHTLYVTNAGSNTVSMIDTSACNAQTTSGCGQTPPSFPVGASPRRIVLDTTDDTVYVVNTGGSSLSMIDDTSCNATDQSGCPTEPAPGTSSPLGLGNGLGSGLGNMPPQDSTCSPSTVASSSGGPATDVTTGAHQVGSGAIEGVPWTLWSKNGQTGADALENAGLVIDGHGYGLCPGYPNPAELELLDANGKTIVYGVIGYPGKTTIKLTTGTTGTFTPGKPLPAPTIQTTNGVSFFIGTLPKTACSYSALELDSTSGKVSAEHNLGFGTCTPGKLSPITFSQGIWQLPAGHFVSNFPGATGRGAPIATGPIASSSCSPSTVASSSGGPASDVTTGAHQVGSGTIEGMPWTLWSKNGETGADALEDAGVVIGGHGYGLCPGYRNPAELELLDANGKTIVYGVIGYPGRTTVKLTTGTTGTFTPGKSLPAPAIQTTNGVSFFIGTLPKSACSYSALELDSTSGKVSAEHNLGFGTCTPGKLSPITFSQGIWQLPAGHFVDNFGAAGP